MPGLYPNKSADAANFKPGDQVKWYMSQSQVSPYVGTVTQVCAATQKVWVDFPVGGNQQKSPEELIMITPFVGQSTSPEDTGYSSYEKRLSEENYGTLREKTIKLARQLVERELGVSTQKEWLKDASSRIAQKFASDTVDKLADDVLACVGDGLSDAQAYYRVYPRYEKLCSDSFVRSAIERIYSHIPPRKR